MASHITLSIASQLPVFCCFLKVKCGCLKMHSGIVLSLKVLSEYKKKKNTTFDFQTVNTLLLPLPTQTPFYEKKGAGACLLAEFDLRKAPEILIKKKS